MRAHSISSFLKMLPTVLCLCIYIIHKHQQSNIVFTLTAQSLFPLALIPFFLFLFLSFFFPSEASHIYKIYQHPCYLLFAFASFFFLLLCFIFLFRLFFFSCCHLFNVTSWSLQLAHARRHFRL